MLSRNIDLTEHHDFSQGGELDVSADTLIYYGNIVNNDNMSVDQHMAIVWWESIFGKTRHTNMKNQIFDKISSKYDNKYDTKCRRCGQNISAPWNRIYDICMDCHNILEWGIKQIPWEPDTLIVVRKGDRGQGDLFELR